MKYSLLSPHEPTDEQLEMLMKAAAEDAKLRADRANARFQALQLQQIEEAFEKRKKRLENGS